MSEQPGGSSPVPQEHDYEDHDKSSLAGHHSLGIHKYQGSPGNHTHSKDDPTSIPLFNDIEVSLDDLSPEEQMDRIWDIFGEYGAVIVRPVGPTYTCADLNDPDSGTPMDVQRTPYYFVPPIAKHNNGGNNYGFVASITDLVLVSTGPAQVRILSALPRADGADVPGFINLPSDFADIPDAGIWRVNWTNLYASGQLSEITVEWTPQDAVTATCLDIFSFE